VTFLDVRVSVDGETIPARKCSMSATDPPGRRPSMTTVAREQFKEYFKAVHATDLLSEREKMFIGLAVTLTRTCEP
jgi:hypothetical protein